MRAGRAVIELLAVGLCEFRDISSKLLFIVT